MRRAAVRTGAFAGALTLGTAGALAAALPANAAPVCTTVPGLPAPTIITPSICEIRVVTVGTGNYTFPSTGFAKVAAVLVGAGGGGYDAFSDGYAGDGGAVVYIDSVPLDTSLAITVGDGGTRGDIAGTFPLPGTATVVDATSAAGGVVHDYSIAYSGDGAGGPASGVEDIVPGPGVVIDAIPGIDTTLFPAGQDTAEYGRGGTGYNNASGGPAVGPTVAGTGGFGHLDGGASTDGVDGLVILRYAPQEPVVAPPAPTGPTLPDTGLDATPGLLAASVLLAAGTGLVGLSRRRRIAA